MGMEPAPTVGQGQGVLGPFPWPHPGTGPAECSGLG